MGLNENPRVWGILQFTGKQQKASSYKMGIGLNCVCVRVRVRVRVYIS